MYINVGNISLLIVLSRFMNFALLIVDNMKIDLHEHVLFNVLCGILFNDVPVSTINHLIYNPLLPQTGIKYSSSLFTCFN